MMDATGWIVGLHLISLHAPNCYEVERVCRRYESGTPGVYFKAPRGLTVGGYSNSYGKPSAYAGWTFETDDRRFALTVAGATGYPRGAVVPLVAPSIRMNLSERLALRLAGSPRIGKSGAGVVHLALEWQTGHR
jgi:hypothetical protein